MDERNALRYRILCHQPRQVAKQHCFRLPEFRPNLRRLLNFHCRGLVPTFLAPVIDHFTEPFRRHVRMVKHIIEMLVVQGANDPRVLKVESDEMVEAMRKNQIPVEYLLFNDEGHGFAKKTNRVKASDAYLSFLNKYLKSSQVSSR